MARSKRAALTSWLRPNFLICRVSVVSFYGLTENRRFPVQLWRCPEGIELSTKGTRSGGVATQLECYASLGAP